MEKWLTPELVGVALNFLAIVASGFVSYLNRKKLNVLHVDVNGRVDELLESTKATGRAEGVLEERNRNGKDKGPAKR